MKLYGVFHTQSDGKYHWGYGTNKRVALKAAKAYHGIVTMMPYNRTTWDAPTFRVCSDIIADYR